MAADILQTGKLPRYTGKGDPIENYIMGEHSAGHHFAPFMPNAAIRSGKWCGFEFSASYVAADFTETKENSGTIAMSANGLLFTTGAADGNSCNIQAVRAYPVTALKNAVFFARINAGDLTNAAIVMGAHVTDSDYFSTEPTHQAVFLKAKGAASNAFVGRTKDGTTGSDVATFNGVDATAYDLAVVVKGITGVQFFYKLASTPTWSKTALKTTNLPAAAQSLRFTLNIENDTSGAGETLTVPYGGAYWQL